MTLIKLRIKSRSELIFGFNRFGLHCLSLFLELDSLKTLKFRPLGSLSPL